MIPENKIEEILERVDLVGLISRHVELKKAGREFKGRCPFHQEKTPSFYVVPEKRFYFCHGCRASGDHNKRNLGHRVCKQPGCRRRNTRH